MVLSLAVKQLRRRGSRFGCPTNASLYSFVLGGAVKAGVGVGSAFFFSETTVQNRTDNHGGGDPSEIGR